MELYWPEELAEADGGLYDRLRAKLDDLFPPLSAVATSSVQAGIGPHLARPVVTPQQITRAFLASASMTKDSLMARIVESRHTGTWQASCSELFQWMGEQTGPGRRSAAYATGMRAEDASFSSEYDRNPLVAFAALVKLSADANWVEETAMDPIGIWDMACGSGPGGWRAATEERWHDSYESAAALDSFAPVVGWGSLEALQSQRSAELGSCPEGLGDEDHFMRLACDDARVAPHLSGAQRKREQYAPFQLHRDRYCRPGEGVTIEETIGDPMGFGESLFDAPVRFDWYGMEVPADRRGEEDVLTGNYVRRSLRAWVFVTSSADPSVASGWNRLMDLPVFSNAGCEGLPDVACSTQGLRLNPREPLRDVDPAGYRTGRELVPKVRCSELMVGFLGVTCDRAPYVNLTGCHQGDLLWTSAPTLYSSEHYLHRLRPPPASPPPPPPPTPYPPPVRPSPLAPPPPPTVHSQEYVLGVAREAEERFCASVYYLSAATRCARFAEDLSARYLYAYDSPPSPPPAFPAAPAPPPVPAAPELPYGLVAAHATRARLSTYRLPSALPAQTPLDSWGYYTANVAALQIVVDATAPAELACVGGAPLPCASGVVPSQCLSGRVNCSTTDPQANMESPHVDFGFSLPPAHYLWGIQLLLPTAHELRQLIVGGYSLRVYGYRREPVACDHSGVLGEPPADGVLTLTCGGSAPSEATLRALAEAQDALFTLEGSGRQLWLAQIRPVARPITLMGYQEFATEG